jgi:acyl-CoA synthetase (AMP-forming)/AMP-acid ligase II
MNSPMNSQVEDVIYDATTVWELVERRAARTPDTVMLLDEGDGRLTFAEFAVRAEQVAAGLVHLGIGPGSVVAWQLPTRIDSVVLMFALARLGAVQSPIIPIYRGREVGAVLAQIGTEFFVVPGTWRGFDYAQMGNELSAAAGAAGNPAFAVLSFEDGLPEGDPATLPVAPTDPDAIRWFYSTSGTTSAPKCVKHSDAGLLAGGVGLAAALQAGPDDVGSICFPCTHIGGPDYVIMMLAHGFGAVLLETFDPVAAVPLFNRHGVTISGGSTAFYLAFLKEQRNDPSKPVIPSLRILSGGGAPKPPEVFRQVREEMNIPVLHGYGMTECPMICQGAWGDTDEQLANTEGAPVLGCEVKVVGPDGREVAADAEGEIRVRGPMLFQGYTDPEATKAAFDDEGYFVTGDRGVKRADGHVFLTGRTKELIIRKGENISPREIEDVLMTHPRVAAVAVIGLPDEERGERVCAAVEMRPGEAPLSFVEMQEHCRAAEIMTQKIPEQLEVLDALPRNATMKILKHELVARFSA